MNSFLSQYLFFTGHPKQNYIQEAKFHFLALSHNTFALTGGTWD